MIVTNAAVREARAAVGEESMEERRERVGDEDIGGFNSDTLKGFT